MYVELGKEQVNPDVTTKKSKRERSSLDKAIQQF